MDFKKEKKHVKNVEPTPKPSLVRHYTNWVEEFRLREARQRLLNPARRSETIDRLRQEEK